ncbi:MAG: hypothetical protein ACO1OT_06950 [Heyndrickxia sp.]
MKNDWHKLKQVEWCQLEGIYAKQLHISQNNLSLSLTTVQPVLKIKNPHTLEYCYWQIDWIEKEEGDDLLIMKEQKTPEPLEYRYEPDTAPHQHLIIASSFFPQHKLIKKVKGYGFKEETDECLTSIVFELENSFFSISTGAVITGAFTDKEPDELGTFLFSL